MCTQINLTELTLNEGSSLKYNLQKEFDLANRKYFGGKVKPVKLRYYRTSKKVGYVSFFVQSRKPFIVGEIRYLTISSYWNLSKTDFLETLLHEMCHLYMLQNYKDYTWKGGTHGPEWKKLAAKISAKAGVKITEKYDTIKKKPTLSKESVKTIYALVFPDLNAIQFYSERV